MQKKTAHEMTMSGKCVSLFSPCFCASGPRLVVDSDAGAKALSLRTPKVQTEDEEALDGLFLSPHRFFLPLVFSFFSFACITSDHQSGFACMRNASSKSPPNPVSVSDAPHTHFPHTFLSVLHLHHSLTSPFFCLSDLDTRFLSISFSYSNTTFCVRRFG